MLSMPQRLQSAALELLKRLRIGLDLPSRSEVLALAERLETLSRQMGEFEQKRAVDAEAVATLRAEAARAASGAKKDKNAGKKVEKKVVDKKKPAKKKPVAQKGNVGSRASTKAAAKKPSKSSAKSVSTRKASKKGPVKPPKASPAGNTVP